MGRRPPPVQSLLAPLSLSENVTMTEKEGGKEKNGIAPSSLSLGRAVLPPFSPAKRGSAAGRSHTHTHTPMEEGRSVERGGGGGAKSPLHLHPPPPFSSEAAIEAGRPAGGEDPLRLAALPHYGRCGVTCASSTARECICAFLPSPPAPCPPPNFFKASFRVARRRRRRQRRRFLEATRYALGTKKRGRGGGKKKRRFAAVNSLLCCSVVPRRRRHIELNDARAGPGI